MKSFAILLVCLLLPAPVFSQVERLDVPETSETDRSAILDAVVSYYDALSARDWERFSDHFWEGATIVTVWQPPGEDRARVDASSVQQFVEQAPAGPGSREIFEERMTSADVRVVGDLATVYARYHARFGDPGDVMEWDGLDQFALLRFETEWKIVSLSFAPDR